MYRPIAEGVVLAMIWMLGVQLNLFFPSADPKDFVPVFLDGTLFGGIAAFALRVASPSTFHSYNAAILVALAMVLSRFGLLGINFSEGVSAFTGFGMMLMFLVLPALVLVYCPMLAGSLAGNWVSARVREGLRTDGGDDAS